MPKATPGAPASRHGEVLDALLTASRALIALAARSLAGLDADVTLPQFRTLVVLAARGPQRAAEIAAELGVSPSTGTRMGDRLVRKGLVRRTRLTTDRRVVRLTVTPAGRALVDEVTQRRRAELTRIVSAIPPSAHAPLIQALRAFIDATGELPEDEWWLGWQDDELTVADAG